MVFVSYADNNSGDCYCMWNPSTSKVTESCDVIWLHQMHYQHNVSDDVAMLPEIHVEMHELSNDDVAAV